MSKPTLLRRELLRASVTRKVGHGQRYVLVRSYRSDGTVMQRINEGDPDDVQRWKPFGKWTDIAREQRRLRREGWEVERPRA